MIRERLLPALGLVLLACVLPSSASAYGIATVGDSLKGTIIRWSDPSIDITVDANGTNGLTAAQSQSCFQASLDDWQNLACTKLSFTVVGTTTNKKVLPMSSSYSIYENGKNELVWINDSSWNFGQQVLGVTMVNGSWSWNGNITESDIAFNGKDYKWNLNGSIGYWNNDMDCKSVVIHELGHLFGLQHVLSGASYSDPPTMAPAVDPNGKSATLSPDDQMGACFLYPVNDYYTCTKNSECPKVVGHDGQSEVEVGQIYCSSGYCQGGGGIAPNSVELGGTCAKASDCVVGTACDKLSSGVTICSRACDTANDDCPTSYHCEVPAGIVGATAICVPGNKKKAIGESCTTSYECATGFCHSAPDNSGLTCRRACAKGGTDCAVGEACWASAYSSTGGCYPEGEVPVAKKKLGAECGSQGECESGLCFAAPNDVARCMRPCDMSLPVCYVGYYCLDMGGGSGACVPGDGKKATGEECAANDECSSAWCVFLATDGRSYCRTSCDTKTWQCEWGFSCVSYGSADYGVCMPSVDKKVTGDACGANAECTSTMCRDFGGTDGRLCTQNCVSGWCPNEWRCVTGDVWGDLCAPLGDEPPPPPVDEGPSTEDRGGATDDVPPVGEDPGSQETDYIGPQPIPSGKGCSAGGIPGVGPLVPLLVALGVLASRRRRDPA